MNYIAGGGLGSAIARGATEFRAPLAAIAAAIALDLSVGAFETARLHAAQGETDRIRSGLAIAERRVAQLRAIEREVMKMRLLARDTENARHVGEAFADDIARLGNSIPRDAWLTSIRHERNTITLEGRSARLISVGSAIGALDRLPGHRGARLLAIRADPVRGGVSYSLSVESTF